MTAPYRRKPSERRASSLSAKQSRKVCRYDIGRRAEITPTAANGRGLIYEGTTILARWKRA
jgi:hypothetical protein